MVSVNNKNFDYDIKDIPLLYKVALVLFLLSFFFFQYCFDYVKPNEYGIKKINIGFKKGIQKDVYSTGLHFVKPFGFEVMYHFPKDLQVLEMSNQPRRYFVSQKRTFESAVRIQTSDGFFVDVDVSIFYSIQNPYKVITTTGPGIKFIKQGIIPKAAPVLKEALGTLTTEDFYNSPLRVKRVEYAKELLQKDLIDKGLFIHHILIRYFRYSREIQKNIEEKKLKDQSAFKNQAESRAAEQRNKLRKVVEEGKARVAIRLEEGRVYVQKKKAAMSMYSRSRHANADLLLDLAKAQKTKLINTALKTKGIEQRIGVEMAKTLKGLEMLVLPSSGKDGFNPLNVDKLVNLFGVSDHE